MELADKINPSEVLAHLKQMGYKNITPHQLKEFMKDLKKLILYDQRSSSSDSSRSLSSSITSDSEYYSSSETSHESNALKGSPSFSKEPCFHGAKRELRQHLSSNNTSKSSESNGGALKRRFHSSSTLSGKQCSQKENQPEQFSVKSRTKSISTEDLQEAIKPRTSFIRPWQLQGGGSGTSRSGKSDPVSLYHYYQALWSQHKCPGEDSHADLRWVVRERMLGQDPHLFTHPQNALGPSKKANRMRL